MKKRFCLHLLAILGSLILPLSGTEKPSESNGEIDLPARPDDYRIEPETAPDENEYNEEEDPCAGFIGRERVLCERRLLLTDYEETSNPCAELTGKERGMCERDHNRNENPGSNPCHGLSGRRRRKCERRHNRGRDDRRHPHEDDSPGGDSPCDGLSGKQRGKCERDKNRGGHHEGDPCANLRGPKKRKCKKEHRKHGDEDVKDLPDANSAGFKEAIIYEPLGNDRIRLAGDSDFYNGGLVKVFRNNTWGYVCDDDWDIKDANVACRQLGFNRGAAKFVSASWYGEAEDGLYLMDDVKCAGDEKRLQKCSYNIDHDCDKNEAAGVICNLNTGCEDKWITGPTGCYRLFSGSISRLSAENKCKSVNGHLVKIETQEENNFLSSILRIRKEKHYWLTDGVKEKNWIWKTDGKPISSSFWFPGWEPQSQFPKPSNNTLKRCLALANAFKYEDSKYLSEYFYWGDINCNNVGNFICETEKTKIPSAAECYTGTGTDYRGSKSVTTKGTPCIMWTKSRKINPSTHPNVGLGDHNYCRNPDGDSRPWCWVNRHKNLFGYCDIPKCSTVTTTTESATKAITTTTHATTSTEESLNCPKDEMYCASSAKCISLSWKCDNEKDCPGGEDEINCDYKLGLFEKKNGRFTIKKDPVEVYISIPLETCARICINHRKFACKAFKYETTQNHCNLYDTNKGITSFFPDFGTYYGLKETCKENDFHCKNGKCVSSDRVCDQYNDCADFSDEAECDTEESIEVRLVDGPDEHSGRVEIKYLNEWGIICDDGWDVDDANVVCRMLGYDASESHSLPFTISDGNRNFFLSHVDCRGNETSLLECKRDPWGHHQCKAHEVVGIVCQVKKVCPVDQFTCASNKHCIPFNYVCDGESDCEDYSDEKNCNIKVQLVGGFSELSGRVEIIRGGVTGTVCDDDFDDNDATVICRMMGHSSGKVIVNTFGEGEGAIWLDGLSCTGSEDELKMCPNLAWGEHDCTHEEDVAIRCFKEAGTTVPTTTVITPTSTPNENEVVCGKRPRSPRTRRDERTVAKPYLSRIVGGTNATYGLYPWQVAVRLVSTVYSDGSKSSSHWCGASILSKFWVISAGHCFQKNVKKERVLLRTGDLNSKTWDVHEQSFEIEYLIIHPSYNSITYDYDVALMKLRPDKSGNGIVFNDYVQPACLPSDNLKMSSGTRCEISGWGSTGQIYPSMLKAATVPLLSRRICEMVYKDITPRMFCAGYLEGGIDTCQGDSGGPLVCSINGVHTLIGITSWGNGCAKPNYPGVYANVAYLKPWITATIAKYS